MKNSKSILFIIILNYACINLMAQFRNYCFRGDNVREELLEDKITAIVMVLENLSVPEDYIYGGWQYATIHLNSGSSLDNRIVRYDGFSDNLILNSMIEGANVVVEKSTISGFDLFSGNSEVMQFRKIRAKNLYNSNEEVCFAQLLVSGKISLYVCRKLMKDGMRGDTRKNYSYILIKPDGSTEHFKKYSQKSLAALFPESTDLYYANLKKTGNHIKNEAQLIDAIKLFNTMD